MNRFLALGAATLISSSAVGASPQLGYLTPTAAAGQKIKYVPRICTAAPGVSTRAALEKLDPAARADVAAGLGDGRARSDCSVPALLVLLDDPSDQVRAEAAAALVRLGKPAVEPLLASLDSGDRDLDPNMRIGKDGQTRPRHSDYLAWVLINTTAPVELELAEHLRRHHARAEVDNSGYRFDPARLFRYIVRERGQRAVGPSMSLLGDSDPNVRSLAYIAVSASGAKAGDALPVLSKIVQSGFDDAPDAIQAAFDVGAAAQPLLRGWLERGANARIRAAAAEGIDPDAAGVEALLRSATSDTDESVRETSLGRLEGFDRLPDASAPALAVLAARSEMRETALEALTKTEAGKERAASLAALVPLVEGTPLEGDSYAEQTLLDAIRTSGGRSAAMHDLLLSRARGQLAAGRGWAVPDVLRAAVAVSPPSATPPIDLLEQMLATAKLSSLPDIADAFADLHPQPAVVAERMRSLLLEGGLDGKLAEARAKPETNALFDSNYYDYRSAAGKAAEILLRVDPASAQAIGTYLERFAKDAAMHPAACDAVDIALSKKDDAKNAASPAFPAVAKLFAAACAPVIPQRPALAVAPLLAEVRNALAKAEEAERQRRAKEQPGTSWQADWATTDDVLKPYFKDKVSGAANEAEVMRALELEPALYRSSALIEYIQQDSPAARTLGLELGRELPRLGWPKIAFVAAHLETPARLGDTGAIAALLLRRIAAADPDWRAWRKASPDAAGPMLATLLEWAPASPDVTSSLRALLRSPDPTLRLEAAEYVAGRGRINPLLRPLWPQLLRDSSEQVRMSAAEAVVTSGDLPQRWDEAADVAIRGGLRSAVAAFLENIADALRPSPLMSGRRYQLPPFPWPPPRYASRAKFGLDLDMALLGRPGETLGDVHRRLRHALEETDPNFEVGLFQAPGGFVMLTKLEQIDSDGKPAAERWLSYRKPPSSLSEYLVALFLSPPGYYRTIAFVFTNESDFGSSDQPLPAFNTGATDLPDDIAKIPLSSRQAFVLVYAFQRRDYGKPRPYMALSASVHLARSGVETWLQQP